MGLLLQDGVRQPPPGTGSAAVRARARRGFEPWEHLLAGGGRNRGRRAARAPAARPRCPAARAPPPPPRADPPPAHAPIQAPITLSIRCSTSHAPACNLTRVNNTCMHLLRQQCWACATMHIRTATLSDAAAGQCWYSVMREAHKGMQTRLLVQNKSSCMSDGGLGLQSGTPVHAAPPARRRGRRRPRAQGSRPRCARAAPGGARPGASRNRHCSAALAKQLQSTKEYSDLYTSAQSKKAGPWKSSNISYSSTWQHEVALSGIGAM